MSDTSPYSSPFQGLNKLILPEQMSREELEYEVHRLRAIKLSAEAEAEARIPEGWVIWRGLSKEYKGSHEYYRHLFEEAPFAYVVLNRFGVVFDINAMGLEMFGLNKTQLRGKPMVVLLEETSKRPFLDHMYRCRQSSGTVSSELVIAPPRSHKVVPVLVNSVIMSNKGAGECYGTAILDLSEKKKIDEMLARTQRLAMMGTFVAGIAHEINNPLNTVTLTSQVALTMARREGRSEQEIEMLSQIVSQVGRCGEIVKSLSRFAKQEQSDRRPVELNAVLGRSVHLSQMYDIRCQVDLNFEGGTIEILANELEIEQVMLNLLKNAAEAKGDNCAIVISSHVENGHAVIVISDNGPGMTREQAAHIFDPFFTTKREKGGSGLGLAIVHAIINSHGGTIDVDSTPGIGTRFIIKLPLASGGRVAHEQNSDH